jgi:hypothetical protein
MEANNVVKRQHVVEFIRQTVTWVVADWPGEGHVVQR